VPFALTVDALKRDGIDPSGPICGSLRIGAEYESLVKLFDACGCSHGPAGHESPPRATAD
jgi:hypothetical protein